MNRKAVILLLGAALAMSGAIIKGTQNANANLPETRNINLNQSSIPPKLNNVGIIAQSGESPWNQRISSQTYRNPDTGQELCFYYNSSRWGPCPGQGDYIIVPENAKCRGAATSDDLRLNCPALQCRLDKLGDLNMSMTTGSSGSTPPCEGLP
jgi:hypothetical protein